MAVICCNWYYGRSFGRFEVEVFPFAIEKTFRMGVAVLGAGLFLSAISFFAWMNPFFYRGFSLGKKAVEEQEGKSLVIPLGETDTPASIPISHLAGELIFFLNRLRPEGGCVSKVAYTLRLKKSGLSQTLSLPVRIGFKYDKELRFAEDENSFWVDLTEGKESQILANVFVPDFKGNLVEVETFSSPVQEIPIRPIGEWIDRVPFKVLSEARVLGRDLFLNRYAGGDLSQRMEIGIGDSAVQISLKEGDFLSWAEEKWKKISSPLEGEGRPLLRIASVDDQGLIFEAWDLAEYIRFSVSSSVPTPLKTKKEDFLTAVRIRSEKQISCMLEKQCFVLRSGDWVLKEDSRWKALRKPQERELYLQGKLAGEIFVFDQIDLKGGQKMLQGFLFNRDRSQMFPIEMGLSSQGKNAAAKGLASIKSRKGK